MSTCVSPVLYQGCRQRLQSHRKGPGLEGRTEDWAIRKKTGENWAEIWRSRTSKGVWEAS